MVTQHCDKRSTLQIFDPGRSVINEDCPSAQIGTVQQKNLISDITVNQALPANRKSAGDQLDMLLEQLNTCVAQNPLAPTEAGVVFVFTDVPCTELCQSANLRSDAQVITETLITRQRFIMKIMFLSDGTSEAGNSHKLLQRVDYYIVVPNR
ncbi:unnamed protein product [Strongylus vulgaris]|uniref:Uncharacterized protein n=1 Tax=Strongylus vulgaris TaxID=40348 RepID=A0A3P7LUF5_STRVU|nr:unnamed protein product [Strongylus vulgaris]